LKKTIACPQCGNPIDIFRNPVPTVDVIIESPEGILLIKRKNPPYGWALSGGFVDYGETVEEAIIREAREETGLDIQNVRQFHSYSAPDRDPRQHTISIVFTAQATGNPKASDDAQEVRFFLWDNLPNNIAFDHRQILEDYRTNRWMSR
jgi:ADP-ribose pyrophosphatase YjhB (NUDIX family)